MRDLSGRVQPAGWARQAKTSRAASRQTFLAIALHNTALASILAVVVCFRVSGKNFRVPHLWLLLGAFRTICINRQTPLRAAPEAGPIEPGRCAIAHGPVLPDVARHLSVVWLIKWAVVVARAEIVRVRAAGDEDFRPCAVLLYLLPDAL